MALPPMYWAGDKNKRVDPRRTTRADTVRLTDLHHHRFVPVTIVIFSVYKFAHFPAWARGWGHLCSKNSTSSDNLTRFSAIYEAQRVPAAGTTGTMLVSTCMLASAGQFSLDAIVSEAWKFPSGFRRFSHGLARQRSLHSICHVHFVVALLLVSPATWLTARSHSCDASTTSKPCRIDSARASTDGGSPARLATAMPYELFTAPLVTLWVSMGPCDEECTPVVKQCTPGSCLAATSDSSWKCVANSVRHRTRTHRSSRIWTATPTHQQ